MPPPCPARGPGRKVARGSSAETAQPAALRHRSGRTSAINVSRSPAPVAPPRRLGDTIAIAGDYQAHVLRSGPAAQRFWHEAKLGEAMRWLAPGPGEVLLDVGCGSGVLASRLAEIPGTRVIGVDGNRAAWEFASQEFRRENLEFRLGLVDELDLAPASIDGIACLEVLEHLQPHQGLAALDGFFRILRPGGRIVITTPNVRSPWPVLEWLLDRSGLAPRMAEDQHVTHYHRRALVERIRQAGFDILASKTFNLFAPWLAFLSWPAAQAVHRIEVARAHSLGCLLLVAGEKPATAPGEPRRGSDR